jgi:cutinase
LLLLSFLSNFAKMKYALVLAAIAVCVSAQCKSVAQIEKEIAAKSNLNPLQQLEPKEAVFPCNFGAAVTLGKIPQGCGKLEFIYARGTSEPGPLGVVCGDPVLARIRRDMPGVNILGYPVQYPASIAGSGTGVSDMVKRLQNQAKACPDSKFVLSGYSQGGMVTLQALGKLTGLADKVVAVVLYGAGDGGGVNAAFKQKTIANCAPGDFACPSAGTGPGHVSYNNKGTGWHDRTAKYIVAAYNGKSQGFKLMRSDK